MNIQVDISGVVLQTERLTLRPWRETDLEDFFAYARVDGVGQMAGWNPHRSMEESAMILNMFIREKKTFAVEFSGRVIGSLGIEAYSEDDFPELDGFKGGEIGYVLSRDHWGQGLMPEAVRAVIAWLFREIGLDFILVGHFDWNGQSRRVVEKCGFRYLKTVRFEMRYDTVENSMQYILWKPERSESGCCP